MSFEDFIEKEINKEWVIAILISIICAFIIGTILAFFIINNKNNCLEFTETEYENVYEFKDKTWFILDRENQEYIFQPVELGDWDYELDTEKELKKILATYFINKYDLEETQTINKINEIFENL